MDKKILLSRVIEALRNERERLETTATATQREANEAPGSMESHSDKTKFEMQTVTGALRHTVEKLGRAIAALEHFTFPPASDRVAAGSLVEAAETDGKPKWYLMLPEGAGVTVKEGKETVAVVTPQTPLGASLMGKGAGETADLKSATATRTLKILRME